jgi:hypothetical protein
MQLATGGVAAFFIQLADFVQKLGILLGRLMQRNEVSLPRDF